MSLRDLVTGNDNCTPSGEVAGPSNALASLADSLLSDKSKLNTQITEFPSSYEFSSVQQQIPSNSQHALVDDAFLSSQLANDPNAFDAFNVARDAVNLNFDINNNDAFQLQQQKEVLQNQSQLQTDLFSQQQLSQQPVNQNQFGSQENETGLDTVYEQIWGQGQGQGWEQDMISMQALEGIFRDFVVSGQQGRNFLPAQLPPIPLSMVQQCKVRDRATIMSRQIFSEQGDEFADQQVANLLAALNIDPQSLPSQIEPIGQNDWNQLWNQQQQPQLLSAEVVEQQRFQQQYQGAPLIQPPLMRPPPHQWINQFNQMNINQQNQPPIQQQPPQQETSNWINEFSAQQSSEDQTSTEDQNGVLENSKALRQTMESHQDNKLQGSQFFQFISKLSHGELRVKDNDVVPGARITYQTDQQQQNLGQVQQGQEQGQGSQLAAEQEEEDWPQEFLQALDRVELGDLEDFGFGGLNQEQIHQQFEEFTQQFDMSRPYTFTQDNKYNNVGDALALAKRLYADGDLREAALAAEEALQHQIQDSQTKVEAWRLLGSIHAENDDDLRAISALAQALKLDPTDLDTLLSLGVSHTNQLDQSQALKYLTSWLQHNPNFDDQIFQRVGPLMDPSQREHHTARLFEEALRVRPDDPDVLTALGVLRHLRQDYDASIDAFQQALKVRPEDHSLWNKLGAAMANGGRSGGALETYRRALELKPNYIRAIANLGISHSNLGDHNSSYGAYLQALKLNPSADSVWEYLRCGLLAAGKVELMGMVDNKDINGLVQELNMQG